MILFHFDPLWIIQTSLDYHKLFSLSPPFTQYIYLYYMILPLLPPLLCHKNADLVMKRWLFPTLNFSSCIQNRFSPEPRTSGINIRTGELVSARSHTILLCSWLTPLAAWMNDWWTTVKSHGTYISLTICLSCICVFNECQLSQKSSIRSSSLSLCIQLLLSHPTTPQSGEYTIIQAEFDS